MLGDVWPSLRPASRFERRLALAQVWENIMSARGIALGLIAGLGFLLLPQATLAEELPRSGTFKGIYHKYRNGQSHFLFFVVPKEFQPQFDPHDGKYIEVEVIKATAGWRQGGIIEELGKITVLPQPTVKIYIELHPPVAGAAGTVDVFTLIENTGKDPLTLSHGPPISGRPGTGGPTIGTYLCGDSSGGGSTLAQGQKLPSVALGWGVGPGPSEIEMSFDTPMGPARAWLNVDVDKSGKVTPLSSPKSRLRVTGQVVRQEQEEMYVVARIANEDDTRRTIYVARRNTSAWQCVPGRIQAFDEHGKGIGISSGPYGEGEWKQLEIPANGMEFRFGLHHDDRFEMRSIRLLVIYLLTDSGFERFEIPIREDLTVPTALPEFGPAVDGHKIRIRMAKSQFGRGDVVRWFLQGVDEKGRRDMFWVDKGHLARAVMILIDGKPVVDDRNHGISEEIVHMFPFQVIMSAVPSTDWKPGTHTVEVTLDGQSGTYTNLNGVQWRKFATPMRSNKCTFDVR